MKKSMFSIILGLLLISGLVCISKINVQPVTSVDKMNFNNDEIIDIRDLASLAFNYNLSSGYSKWNSKYDLNEDNITDIL